MSVYQENGYESRDDYLKCMSEDYERSLFDVYELSEVLGQDEDFDMLVTTLDGV